jgi:hypothetical protein
MSSKFRKSYAFNKSWKKKEDKTPRGRLDKPTDPVRFLLKKGTPAAAATRFIYNLLMVPLNIFSFSSWRRLEGAKASY